jgi:hypothetical protein
MTKPSNKLMALRRELNVMEICRASDVDYQKMQRLFRTGGHYKIGPDAEARLGETLKKITHDLQA